MLVGRCKHSNGYLPCMQQIAINCCFLVSVQIANFDTPVTEHGAVTAVFPGAWVYPCVLTC